MAYFYPQKVTWCAVWGDRWRRKSGRTGRKPDWKVNWFRHEQARAYVQDESEEDKRTLRGAYLTKKSYNYV